MQIQRGVLLNMLATFALLCVIFGIVLYFLCTRRVLSVGRKVAVVKTPRQSRPVTPLNEMV